VEVAAPGGVRPEEPAGGLWSTGFDSCGLFRRDTCSTYFQDFGTSMAAPIVAGVAALVRSANPSLSAADVGTCLVATAGKRTGSAFTRSALPARGRLPINPALDYAMGQMPIVDAEAAVVCGLAGGEPGGGSEPPPEGARQWTVGPLSVYLDENWGPVGSADPSNGWAADLTNQTPCTNCTDGSAWSVSAAVGLWNYGSWCTGTVEECTRFGTRLGDAPPLTVGGRTPDYSGRAEMSGGYTGTMLFWCFTEQEVCIQYQRGAHYPQLEPSAALFDLLDGATWSG
jgi:hypothetical protein